MFHLIHKFNQVDAIGQLLGICKCNKTIIVFCNVCQGKCEHPRSKIFLCHCCNKFKHLLEIRCSKCYSIIGNSLHEKNDFICDICKLERMVLN